MANLIRVDPKPLWLNMDNVVMIEATEAEPPTVKVYVNNHPDGKHTLDYTGDEAEAVLAEVGYDKVGRTAQKEAEAKAAHAKAEAIAKIEKDAAAAADKAAANARATSAKAEKAHPHGK